jgi:fatty-acyl-CoA synthase
VGVSEAARQHAAQHGTQTSVLPGLQRTPVRPQATAQTFTADGWLRTGDLGRIDEDDYLLLVGRTKESYRCGGELVMPTEIEDLLVTHPAVLQAHVVPIPDERMGEVGCAFVVCKPGTTTSVEDLIAWARQHMANYKVPRQVRFAESLPVNASNKVDKKVLRAM